MFAFLVKQTSAVLQGLTQWPSMSLEASVSSAASNGLVAYMPTALKADRQNLICLSVPCAVYVVPTLCCSILSSCLVGN